MHTAALLLTTMCFVQAAPAKSAPPKTAAAQPARKEVKLSEKALKSYVGDYAFDPDRVLTISFEDGSLWGQPSNQSAKRQLFAESATKFFLKDLEIQITFQKDAKGNVTGLLMDQTGKPQRELNKVK